MVILNKLLPTKLTMVILNKLLLTKISENMLSHIYSQVNHFLLLQDINNHFKDAYAINRADGFLTSN